MISVDIRDDQKIFALNRRALRAFLKEAIRFLLPGKTCRLSIAFVEDGAIARLNARYLGENCPTDVLAFPMQEGRSLSGDIALLGDVVISTQTARQNAKRFRSPFEAEVALYLVHGLLHLLGYRDKTSSQKQKMRRKEREVLRRCGRVVSPKRLIRA